MIIDKESEKGENNPFLDTKMFISEVTEEHNNLFNLDISSIVEEKSHYFCHICNFFPYIQFDNQFLSFTCKCGENKIDLFFGNENNFSSIINESNSSYNDYKNTGLKCEKGHKFKYYCTDCHKNLCKLNCQEHLNHTLINFDFINFEINLKANKLIKFINANKENESAINDNSEIIEEKSYLIINSDEKYIKIEKRTFYELIRYIIEDYYNFPNYSHFFNIDNIYKYLKNELNNQEDIKEKSKKNIIDMNINDYDYMDITYINNLNGETKLFGEKFVENNKDNTFIITDKGKNIELVESYNFGNKSEKISIKLIIIKERIDMSFMFYNCTNLKSLSNISKWTKTKIISTYYLFYNCADLDLPDILDWDISKINNFHLMFCNYHPSVYLDKWENNIRFKDSLIFGFSNSYYKKYAANLSKPKYYDQGIRCAGIGSAFTSNNCLSF